MYSEIQIEQLYDDYEKQELQHKDLLRSFFSRDYKENTREFVRHAFSRRLLTLHFCINRIFNLIPPGNIEEISRDARMEAEISLHSFYINLTGAIDNLAWIFVHEKLNVSDINKHKVGLKPGKKYKLITNRLSEDFRNHLNSLSEWFNFLDSYRDALAHQVPLYIPPYHISSDDMAQEVALQKSIDEATNTEERNKFSAEQKKLHIFEPRMLHSFEKLNNDKYAGIILFHPQILTDYRNLFTISKKMLVQLDQ